MAQTVIGRLDRQITFQTFTEAADAVGQMIKTWANLTTDATVWARVERTRGSEEFVASHVELAKRTVTFVVRWRSELTEEMRVVHNSQNWDIELIETIGREDMLKIRATADVA